MGQVILAWDSASTSNGQGFHRDATSTCLLAAVTACSKVW
jgi:hypothetical protein